MSFAVLFSVIMPVYNASSTLRESLDSVLGQTLADFEVLIVDDCSLDESRDIINEYALKDSRIKPIFSDVNQGVAKTRNLGISLANGCYIAFLDSDDLWLPSKLEEQYKFFLNGAKVVFSSYFRFFPDGTEKLVTAPGEVDYKALLHGNCIGNVTGSYDAHVLGKFYQESVGHEDYLMWLRILSTGVVAFGVPFPLARYRVGFNSLSANKFRAAMWTWQIYRDKLKFGFLRSFYFFCSYIIYSLLKRL